MSNLICCTCKYRIEKRQGHRIFIDCSDKNKEKGFHQDNFFYHSSCPNYEEDSTANIIKTNNL